LICRELCRLWLNTDNPLESFAKLKEVFLKNASGFLNNKQKESNLDFFGFIIRQISGFINSTGEKLSGFWTGNSPLLMNLQMDALDLCDYYVAIINNTGTGQETFYYSVLFNIESIYKFSFLSKIISPENIIKIINRCTKILNDLSISQANEECNIKRSELLKLFSENRITDELDIEQFAQNDPNVFLCGTGQYKVFKGDHIVYVNNMKNQEIFYKDYKKAKKFFMGVQIRPKSPFKSGLFYEIQNGRQEEFIKKWNSLV